ncbi:MAG: HIT family protein [Myxococcota bacterium]
MENKDCIFCQIAKKERNAVIIYEDDYTMAFADLYPLMKGHTLIIPKRHFTNIYELNDEYATHIFKTTTKVAKKIKEVLKPDGINIHQSNERAAGQEVFHLHIHIIPRYIGQRLFIFHIERKRAEENELIQTFLPLINAINDQR